MVYLLEDKLDRKIQNLKKEQCPLFVIESCFVFTMAEPDGSSRKTMKMLGNDSIQTKVVVIYESTTRWQHSNDLG